MLKTPYILHVPCSIFRVILKFRMDGYLKITRLDNCELIEKKREFLIKKKGIAKFKELKKGPLYLYR